MSSNLKFIPSKDALPLRQKVLRPDKSVEDCVYANDNSPETFHVGAFLDKKIIGIATFLEEPRPDLSASRQFRLRGMATDPDFRGKNVGRSVLEFGIQELQRRGADLLWCNARIKAFEFYEKLGLTYHGPLFDMKDIGPHKVMYKYL